MIIEMTRQVPQGIKGSIKHFLHKEKGTGFEDDAEFNEEVHCLTGTSQDVESFIKMAAIKARVHKRKYSLRHFFISPDQEITQAQLRQVVRNIMDEFGVKQEDGYHAHIVQHIKYREDGSAVPHYHLLMNEVGYKNNKVMNSSSFKQKCTYVARRAELDLNHKVQPSFYSRYVIQRLKDELDKDIRDETERAAIYSYINSIKQANAIVEEPARAFYDNKALETDGIVYKPQRDTEFAKTFSMREMNSAQRAGINLPEVRHIFMTTPSMTEAVQKISNKFGVSFQAGDKAGVILLSKGKWKKSLHKIAPLTTDAIATVLKSVQRTQERAVYGDVMAGMESAQENYDIPAVADEGLDVTQGRTSEDIIWDPDATVTINELYALIDKEEKEELRLEEERRNRSI